MIDALEQGITHPKEGRASQVLLLFVVPTPGEAGEPERGNSQGLIVLPRPRAFPVVIAGSAEELLVERDRGNEEPDGSDDLAHALLRDALGVMRSQIVAGERAQGHHPRFWPVD